MEGADEMGMGFSSKRIIILVLALVTLAVSLVACESPSGNTSTGDDGGSVVLATQAGQSASPTPTFPPFTIGAWPSNFSPSNSDTVTIYVITRVQDPKMTGPSKPPSPGVTVTIFVGDPINQRATETTGADGIAAHAFTFNDPDSGKPVTVQVTTTWNQHPYSNTTFFTPSPKAKPTATPGAAPTGTATGTPGTLTPTVGAKP